MMGWLDGGGGGCFIVSWGWNEGGGGCLWLGIRWGSVWLDEKKVGNMLGLVDGLVSM